jgi:putative transport protein
MDWLSELLFRESIANTVLLFSVVIATGVFLGKIKIFGISLGVTFVLFMGILFAHLGFHVEHSLLHFIKEFGLILFVFSIGLQVGPGFFSSFKKGGMRLNALALMVIALNVIIVITLFYLLQGRVSMAMMVGVMSGAITNTPGLGAAQQALEQLYSAGQITEIPQIALGYAVAYPFGVMGIILSLIFIRYVFKIQIEKETEDSKKNTESSQSNPLIFTIKITNKNLYGKTLYEVKKLASRSFVISRLKHETESQFIVPDANTVFSENDILVCVVESKNADFLISFLGERIEYDWEIGENRMVSHRAIVTNSKMNGKTIRELHLRSTLGVNITRVNRSGIELLGSPDLILQIGDKVTIVGEENAVERTERLFGNSLKRLKEPNLITIFIGILFGIILGSIPIYFPGMPMPVKLGLAGGPLIVAILIGRFGYKAKLVTYTTQSANLMLRELGICLFLASVGIGAGGSFVDTVLSGDGLLWVGCGFIITTLPLLIVGLIARLYYKMNYFTIMGLLSGSTTDPPALAYANATAGNDMPAVAYSTVYPLTMFLRVLIAQFLILIFL